MDKRTFIMCIIERFVKKNSMLRADIYTLIILNMTSFQSWEKHIFADLLKSIHRFRTFFYIFLRSIVLDSGLSNPQDNPQSPLLPTSTNRHLVSSLVSAARRFSSTSGGMRGGRARFNLFEGLTGWVEQG